jgi:mRNA-degrading endonuclease RelE of RelBE toxin-antitoxin system
MQNDSPLILVEVTAKFKRNLRSLAKKYRSIRKDIQPIIEQLQAGELPGDQIPGVGYTIFKLRVKNSDVQKGKSGGYRLIYYVKTSTSIILVTIYSKSEQEDMAAEEIQQILAEFEQEQQEKQVDDDSE